MVDFHEDKVADVVVRKVARVTPQQADCFHIGLDAALLQNKIVAVLVFDGQRLLLVEHGLLFVFAEEELYHLRTVESHVPITGN